MRIAWLTCGEDTRGSCRLEVSNVSKELQKMGIESDVVFRGMPLTAPVDLQDTWLAYYDIFVLHNLMDTATYDFVKRIHAANKKAIFQVSDLYNDLMHRICDYVTVTSTYLGDLLAFYYSCDVRIIQDCWENPDDLVKKDYTTEEPTVVWFGSSNNNYFYAREKIEPILHQSGWKSVWITIHPTATIQYDHRTVYDEMLKCDICIIPSMLMEEHKCKSPNRVVQAMVLGLPVIVSPAPDYLPVVRTYRNGFVAFTPSDWVQYLGLLKQQGVREQVGKQGRKDVLEPYNIVRQANQWIELFKEALC